MSDSDTHRMIDGRKTEIIFKSVHSVLILCWKGNDMNTILNISAYCKVEKNFPSSKIHFQYLLCLPFHLMTDSLKFWQQSVKYANVGQIDSSFRPTCIRFFLPKGNPKLYFGIPMWRSSKMRWKHTQGAIRVSCW